MRVLMVSPQNMDVVVGELEGVVPSSTRLSFSYYSNTRTNGKLDYIGDGWVRGTFLRFEHDGRELGTYAVTDESAEIENGAVHHSLELRCALYLLDTDIADQPWLIGGGQSVKSAASQLLKSCSRPYRNDGNDYSLKSPTVYESGDSQLKRLFSLCDIADNRVEVDGHGLVTIDPYIEPSRRSASFEIDLADPEGSALDGISFSTDYLSLPNRVSVFKSVIGSVEANKGLRRERLQGGRRDEPADGREGAGDGGRNHGERRRAGRMEAAHHQRAHNRWRCCRPNRARRASGPYGKAQVPREEHGRRTSIHETDRYAQGGLT